MKITLPNGNVISIDNYLAEKLDLMCEKVTDHKFDNLIIIDGDEGYGKSNLAAVVCGYVHYKTGRPLTNANVFFGIDKMVDFAKTTKKQIVWWDEAALGGLAMESYNKVQLVLLKLLFVARKKQHFYVFVIPKFYKLREPIIDRAVALLHVYSRDGLTRGRFAYFKTDNFDKLYAFWNKKREKGYKYYYNSCGSFSRVMGKVINEAEYERQKDEGILSIGSDTINKKNKALEDTKKKLTELKSKFDSLPGVNRQNKAIHLGISPKTLQRWGKPDD